MKKVYLLAIICIAFISCSKDDTSESIQSSKKNEVFNFSSYEKMDEKIDQISLTKDKMEESTARKHTSKNIITDKSSNSGDLILNDLKKYHTDRLNDIYSLRKDLNFISIQSIADEINSLKLLNPIKSEELSKEYEKFLIKSEFGVITIFDNRTANVINEKGEVLIDGQIIDLKISDQKKITGRYLYDEAVRIDRAVRSEDMRFVIIYTAGREKHKDTFGKVFFRYFTEFNAYYTNPESNGAILCPTTFTMSNNSIAGFSQSGDNPFAEFAFSIQYPSGNGSTLRNTSGQKWTAYQTEGGYLKGSFVGAGYLLTCDFRYTK